MKKMKRLITAAAAAVIFTASLPLSAVAVEEYKLENGGKPTFSIPSLGFVKGDGAGELVQVPLVGTLKKAADDEQFPRSFSLRGDSCMTSVKNQTGYGTCWAHSAAASAESSLAARVPYIDLSEFHTAYYSFFANSEPVIGEDISDIFSMGGNCYYVGNLWSQWCGPVSEKRIPYGNVGFFSDKSSVELMKGAADYHLRNAYIFDFDKERTNFNEVNSTIKSFVSIGKAVDVSFYNDNVACYDAIFNSTNSRRKPRFADHSVAIVGWDDDFPAEKFLIPAENNGAWLVKNSWGADFGDGGFMWISYEDASLCEFSVFELEDADNFTKMFRHDSFVPVQTMSAADEPLVDTPSYVANIFTADDTVQIEAISTFISQPDTNYEVTIYTGLSEKSNPTSGRASAVTKGKCPLTGFETIELDEDVIVSAGEDFAVVVRLQCDDTPFVVPLESCVAIKNEVSGEMMSLGNYGSYEQIKANTSENESLYSTDGIEWLDMTDGDYWFSDEEKEMLLIQLEDELYDGLEPEDTELLADAENQMNMYRSIFAMGPAMLAVGNIPIKALGNPLNTVDFNLPSGRVTADESVSLTVKDGEEIFISVNGGEYIPYTEPLKITKFTNISATVDRKTYTLRTFVPEDFVGKYGDVNGDGSINAADASLVLAHYSSMSTGGGRLISRFMDEYADIAINGQVDASDASAILALYAELSTKIGEQT